MSGGTLEAVLAELGETIGVGPIALDDNGACALTIDGDLVVHLAHDEGDGRAVVYAPLGPLPAGEREPVLTRLLTANAVGWAVCALEPATGRPVLLRRFATQGLDRHGLEVLIERFVATAREWRKVLGAADASADAETAMRPLDHFMGHGIRA